MTACALQAERKRLLARESGGTPDLSDRDRGFSGAFSRLCAGRTPYLDNNYATLNFLIWPQRLPELPFLREGTSLRLIRDHICLRGRFLASFEAEGPLTPLEADACMFLPPPPSHYFNIYLFVYLFII